MARIMIVDDERDVVTLMKYLLERDGHEVLEAYDGEEALAKLGVRPENPEAPLPDLIIMDVMMPVLDGFSVAQRLGRGPRTAAVPILLLTAKGELRELAERSSNVAAFIDKPFDPKKLRDLVASMLETAR